MPAPRFLRIRDPVHGYVAVTELERLLLDYRTAQRLRNIAQSGLVHYVFPEVRTSRFAHSLGSMHLASRFLRSALRNASDETRSHLVSGFREAVESAAPGYSPSRDEIERLRAQPLLARAVVELSEQTQCDVLLIEQALRLAALFHDLGHLPFSHDFEYVLAEVVRGDVPQGYFHSLDGTISPPHEAIGYALAPLLYDAVLHGADDLGASARPVVDLAQMVLNGGQFLDLDTAEPPFAPATKRDAAIDWLHSIVAGEVDVDRMDYLLRDARAYGFAYVSFDSDRLVDNLTAVGSTSGARVVTAITPQGQPAVESFLFARYRMYQWGIRHHKVQQVSVALRAVTKELLLTAMGNDPKDDEVARFLDDVARIAASSAEKVPPEVDTGALVERFASYDDGWWMLKLRDLAEASDDPWANLACWRTRGIVSLWKRPMDFPGGPEELRLWNSRLPERGLDSRWEEVVSQLESKGVRVVRQHFSPYRSGDANDPNAPSLIGIADGNRLRPLTEASPLVASLRDAWASDVQVHAFATAEALESAGGREKLALRVIEGLESAMRTSTGTTATPASGDQA